MCIIILRRDLLLHSHGALLPAPTPRRLLDGRPPRIHRRWRPRLRSFGPSRHRQATRARHCRPGLERCRCLPGATAVDSPIRSDYAMSTAPVVPDAPAPRATASPPPPAHIFKDKKISPGDPVFRAQPSEPPSGTASGACSRAPVSPGQCLLAPLFRAIDGPPVAPLAGQAASPTPRRTQQLGGALRL